MSADRILNVALVGQPNVGKSSLFTRLTGVGVISSNYPGTTVEFEEGVISRKGQTVSVHDLPGTYALSGSSDDEKVVIDELSKGEKDAVIVVADAMDLPNGLALCFEVLELGIPTILALTKIDESQKRYSIDCDGLSDILGIPVIPVSAKTSEGVDALADAVCDGRAAVSGFRIGYDEDIEKAVTALADGLPDDLPFDKRGIAVKILENSGRIVSLTDDKIRRAAGLMRKIYAEHNGTQIGVSIASARYSTSDRMSREFVTKSDYKPTPADKISELTITPSTGIPILAGVCLLILFTIVYVGSFLDGLVSGIYDAVIGDGLIDVGASTGSDFWTAVMTGIDSSIRAILGLVIPYIMVFYLILGVLEDSGYLTRAVVLLDRTMHHFGLHGGAFIPMIVGLGCNVPAIMAVRTIQSRREKIILSSMIVMAVPCSAQMAIIMGATGHYSGVTYAFGIMLMLACIAMATGVLLNRFLKYEPSNLAMELPEMQMPTVRNVLFKTWYRIKDFFLIAFPLLVVGSIIIEILLTFDLLDIIVGPLSPVTVGMLGLPAVCSIAFIVGILRKEMALGMLQILAGGVALSEFMTPDQFVVFGVVMAVYMPCAATLITMWREIGWKETIAVSAVSIAVAVVLGSCTNMLLGMF